MDDITIPPRPTGWGYSDYTVKLQHKGTGVVSPPEQVKAWRPRYLTVRGVRSEDKARTLATIGTGAGWEVVSVEPLYW
jgi:hypothetical protein